MPLGSLVQGFTGCPVVTAGNGTLSGGWVTVPDPGADLGPPEAAEAGIFSFCPTLMSLDLSPLAVRISLTDTPYFLAIRDRLSPPLTVWDAWLDEAAGAVPVAASGDA